MSPDEVVVIMPGAGSGVGFAAHEAMANAYFQLLRDVTRIAAHAAAGDRTLDWVADELAAAMGEDVS